MSIKIIAENKKARFDFILLESFEAGLVLTGSEVKSLRNNQVQLKDAYVILKGHEAFLQNAHISIYNASSYNNHEPERLRKLLLNKSELAEIEEGLTEKGLTCVPVKIYFKRGKAKIEVALAKGKKKGDKRESTKTKESKREIDRAMKKSR